MRDLLTAQLVPPLASRSRRLTSPTRACRAAALILALGAWLGASRDRPVVVDLAPAPYAASVERFAAGARDVAVDTRAPAPQIPYLLPGPADPWAGGTGHALRLRLPERPLPALLLELHVRETHDTAPPRLSVDAAGPAARIQTRPGGGQPPPHRDRGGRQRYTVRLPAPTGGEAPLSVLTITNEAGSWLMWERIRLVHATPAFAWSHLARTGALPRPGAGLLLAALGVTLAATRLAARGREAASRLGALTAPAVALAVFGSLAWFADGAALDRQPRWLTLSLPWLFLAAAAALGRRSGTAEPIPGRVRAWAGRGLEAAIALLLVHLVLILFTGGYALSLAGVTVSGARVAPPVIAVLALASLRALGRAGVSRRALAAHGGLLLFALLAIVYLANGRSMGFFDTRGARYLPLSLLREGDFDLDEFRPRLGEAPPAYIRVVGGRYLSGYPLGAPVLALPFYVPAALGGLDPESPVGADLEKLSAAVLIALSAVVLFLAARRLTSAPMAWLIALVYGLATSSLSASSQALWQHAAAQPALAAAIYALVRGRSEPRWLAAAGFALAFAVVSRPPNLLLVLPLALYVVVHYRARAAPFLLAGLAPLVFQFWYDLTHFGDPFHSHLPTGYSPWSREIWDTPLLEGLAGLLVSPGRGLFVYSPVLLFSLVGLALAWRRGGDPLVRYSGVGAALLVLLCAKWRYWPGGPVFGPRLLADLTPLLALALWPLRDLLARRAAFRLAFGVALGWSVTAHAIGAFYDDWRWNHCTAYDRLNERMWSWTDNQLAHPLKRAAIHLAGPPTSRTHPSLLAAFHRLDAPPAVEAGQPLRLTVAARNVGGAVWLAHARGDDASLVLRWRWRREPAGDALLQGWLPLCTDTFPGETATFRVLAQPPGEPGAYVLEAGLTRAGDGIAEPGMPPTGALLLVREPHGPRTAAGASAPL